MEWSGAVEMLLLLGVNILLLLVVGCLRRYGLWVGGSPMGSVVGDHTNVELSKPVVVDEHVVEVLSDGGKLGS